MISQASRLRSERVGGRGPVGRFGAFLIETWRRVALTIAVGLTAIWRMFLLRTWRSTVRGEFVRHCWQVGIRALPTTMLTAAIVGIALVFQFMFLRQGAFGDVLTAFNLQGLLLLTLVREITPVLVAMIIIGRSATVIIHELVSLRAEGQIHTLDAQGIDTFDYLIVSRVAALAVCGFCLGVVFVVTALVAGQILGTVTGVARYGFFQFMIYATQLLSPTEYLMLPLKTIALGIMIGVVACVTALRPTREGTDVRELVTLGFMRAVVAALILSGCITGVVVAL